MSRNRSPAPGGWGAELRRSYNGFLAAVPNPVEPATPVVGDDRDRRRPESGCRRGRCSCSGVSLQVAENIFSTIRPGRSNFQERGRRSRVTIAAVVNPALQGFDGSRRNQAESYAPESLVVGAPLRARFAVVTGTARAAFGPPPRSIRLRFRSGGAGSSASSFSPACRSSVRISVRNADR